MKSWRLNWTLQEVFSLKNYLEHYNTLSSSWRFWYVLLVKFFPRLYKKPILLRLKDKGAFFVRDFMTLYIYKEIFIDKVYDEPKLTEKNPVIVDIGANTGLFAIRMKQLYPSAELHCFEPFEINFKQLERNIKFSELENVNVYNFGISGTSRKEKLYIHQSNLGGHSIIQSETSSEHYSEIELVAIKEIFKSLGIAKCHLLKMDCEGAEYEIIKSMDYELASAIEKIIFEPTLSLYDFKELKDHLLSIGFVTEERPGLCIAVNSQNKGV